MQGTLPIETVTMLQIAREDCKDVVKCTESLVFSMSGINGLSVVASLVPVVASMSILHNHLELCYCSDDFRNIMERSLRKIAEVVVEDLGVQIVTPGSGLPLATLLPKVGHLSSPLLEEPNKNKHIQIIRSMPEVELFYTFLYANMPPET